MANCCDVSIHIVIPDKEQAQACYQWLENAREEANKKGEGFQLGNAKQWIFDSDVEIDSNDVSIYGWIKWGWDDDVPEDFVRTMLDKGWNIAEVNCEFHEPSCLYHGDWHYTGDTGVMEARVLDQAYMMKFYEGLTEQDIDADDHYDKMLAYVEAAPDDQYETWTTQIKEIDNNERN